MPDEIPMVEQTWELPCGCVGSFGPDAQTCDHECHWIHRMVFA